MEKSLKELNLPSLWMLLFVLAGAITLGISTYSLLHKGGQVAVLIVQGMFLTGLLSMVFIYMVIPLVNFLERTGFGKVAAVSLTYFLIIGGLVFLIVIFSPDIFEELKGLKEDLPTYMQKINNYIKGPYERLNSEFPYLKNFNLEEKFLPAATEYAQTAITQITLSIFSVLSLLILVPLFSFFLLIDGHLFKKSIYALVPNKYFEMTMDMMNRINRQLGAFIRGRVIEAAFVGLTLLIGMNFVNMKYTVFLAVFAGLANLVPYIGPIIGMAPGIAIAFLELNSVAEIAWICILYIIVAQVIVDMFILIPILIAKVANLHPLIIFLAIIIGGNLGGILGMIIAVPFVNIVSITFTIGYKYIFKRKSIF